MEWIKLTDELQLKKIDLTNEVDRICVRTLDRDPLIYNEEGNGYLWNIEKAIESNYYGDYLERNSIYQAPYLILNKEKRIGFIDISEINKFFYIDLAYALLEDERKKGYATLTLKNVTSVILEGEENIKKVVLTIDKRNRESQNVAINAGFVNVLSEFCEESLIYEKTKTMLSRERIRK